MPHRQIQSSSCNHPSTPGVPGTARSFGRGYRLLLVLCLLVLVAINGLSSSSDPSLTSVPPSAASSLSLAEVALPPGPSAPTSVVPFASFFSLRAPPLAHASILPFPTHPLDLPDFSPASEAAAPTSSLPERSLRLQSTRRMLVTAYCPGKCCCGKDDGITASGRNVRDFDHHLVAAPPDIPFRTLVSVPGYIDEQPVPVLDRGGMIQGDRLDVCFPTHAQAKAWGSQWLDVSFWSHQEKSD